MESFNQVNNKNKVHKILMQSYFVYFLLFLFSIALDFIFHFKIFTDSVALSLGTAFLIFATFLIFWAQKTSRDLKIEKLNKEAFCRGPYCYTRSPTHLGLFFLILGFGIITNAVFVILFTLISFFITKFIFLDKQEKILEEKYGTHYIEYKKLVKF